MPRRASPRREREYENLTVAELGPRLPSLSKSDLKKVRGCEEKRKNRKGAIEAIDRAMTGK